MNKTVKTPKGTELPLINLKGKDYLQVAHRLQWLNEAVENFTIETVIIKAEKDESIVRSIVTLFSKEGKVIKSVSATKREDAKGFADHLEKAETGSIGRCLALCGFGTQFAVSDLDEGDRIVDAPVTNLRTQPVAAKSAFETNAAAKVTVNVQEVVAAHNSAKKVEETQTAQPAKLSVPKPFIAKPKVATKTTGVTDGI
jgi:uncharacterized protein involved in propanediol utilization